MPPKKTAAKKSPAKPDPKKTAKDARRTFEHLGRVHALMPLTSAETEDLKTLTHAADSAYTAKLYKESADLLRAAEHLSFASLHTEAEENVATELEAAIREEFDHLAEKAKEHAAKQVPAAIVARLLKRMTHDAGSALSGKRYRAALEFARGAEALAHVHQLGNDALPKPEATKRLKA